MINTIYIEHDLRDHPRTRQILKKYARARVVECEHYGEIFNRKGQNFRLQKQAPALILARKNGRRIYPTPPDHALGAPHNYYFSHLLNCPFDCRYCFLQGKFSSANYVLFINYEDFLSDLNTVVAEHNDTVHIFSGYDCDSLAFEPISGFAQWLVGNLPEDERYLVELRTKSAQIRQLKRQAAHKSILVAYSLAPESVIDNAEHGTASLVERLTALQSLQSSGWQIGLRIDPLIYFDSWQETYRTFFEQIREYLSLKDVHSVTLGTMRFPDGYYKKIRSLYPRSPLLASVQQNGPNSVGYPEAMVKALVEYSHTFFSQHIDTARIFTHHAESDD